MAPSPGSGNEGTPLVGVKDEKVKSSMEAAGVEGWEALVSAESFSASFSYGCSSRRNRPSGVRLLPPLLLLPEDKRLEPAAARAWQLNGTSSGPVLVGLGSAGMVSGAATPPVSLARGS